MPRAPLTYLLFLLIFTAGGVPAYQNREFLFSALIGEAPEASIKNSEKLQSRLHEIELKEDGFYPKELRILPGDMVRFYASAGKSFWPASNTHPSHTLYPEFDPRKPIPPQESWEFVFERTGKWHYHDHLRPGLTGIIIVSGGSKNELNCGNLRALEKQQKEHCYDELLTQALEKDGVAGSFRMLKELYQKEPDFVTGGCHQYTHKIGDKIYRKYAKLIHAEEFNKLELPPETIYCGYGFYHGILEHSFREKPDIELGKELCEYLDKTHGKVTPRIRLNCFHSLGHASIREPENEKAWGDPQKIVAPALEACEKISENLNEVRECFQGAFNVIADWIWRGEYGLSPDRKDPLGFCREQKREEHALSCYYEMAMHLHALVGDDIEKLSEFAESIENQEAAGWVMHVAAAGILERAVVEKDHSRFIFACRKVEERLYQDCLEGISGGLVAHGEPEQEYVKALNFCRSAQMTKAEKEICYRHTFNTMKGIYPQQKLKEVCLLAEKKYRHFCK